MQFFKVVFIIIQSSLAVRNEVFRVHDADVGWDGTGNMTQSGSPCAVCG